MKNKSLLFSAVTLFTAALSLAFVAGEKGNKKQDKNNKSISANQAQSDPWLFEVRKNQITGTIPTDAVLRAQQQVEQLRAEQANSKMAAALNWTELGPDNFAGWISAIVVDKNDASGNTIWAGASGGGLWKSTTGGEYWAKHSQTDMLPNMVISCIAQAPNNNLYFGTGDLGFGHIGKGVWKSTDLGVTFTQLAATNPAANNSSDDWAVVTEIAVSPSNSNRVYAATLGGAKLSDDGGTTWVDAVTVNAPASDVDVASDGTVAFAINGKCYISANGDAGTYTNQSAGAVGDLPDSTGRLEIAFTADPNYLYASLTNSYNGELYQAYRSTDKGDTWTVIGTGGSALFAPLGHQFISSTPSLSTFASGFIWSTIATYPGTANRDKVIIAGEGMWRWTSSIGWEQIDSDLIPASFWLFYMNAGKNVIKFPANNSNLMYVGTVSGVFRSTNAMVSDPLYTAMNRSLNVSPFYSVSFNNSGSQYMGSGPNGTWYNYHTGNTWAEATQVHSLAGKTELSMINNDGIFVSGHYGNLRRSGNTGTSFGSFYSTGTSGITGITSPIKYLDPAFASAITPIALWESTNATSTLDSLIFYNDSIFTDVLGTGDSIITNFIDTLPFPQPSATLLRATVKFIAGAQTVTSNAAGILSGDGTGNVNTDGSYNLTFNAPPDVGEIIASEFKFQYNAGAVITVESNSTTYNFNYTIPSLLPPDSGIKIQDIVQAVLAVGMTNAVYATKQPINFATSPKWVKCAGKNSTPDTLRGICESMQWSKNGNILYVGTREGYLYRVANWDSVSLYNQSGNTADSLNGYGGGETPNPYGAGCVLNCNRIANFGRIITDIAVDPLNAGKVMVTLGNYDNTGYVYYTDSAEVDTSVFAGMGSFLSKQGNLPQMPVYSGVLEMGADNTAIIGTEYGVYQTGNITAASPTWTQEITGMANTPVLDVRQQQHTNFNVLNSGALFCATYGRGWFTDGTAYSVPTGQGNPSNPVEITTASLTVFPNPMTEDGNILITLPNDCHAVLSIHNMLGQKVQTFNLGKLTAGSHIVPFTTSAIKPGTYFAIVQAGTEMKVAKFIVNK